MSDRYSAEAEYWFERGGHDAEECPVCEGDGLIPHYCGDDTCCCLMPEPGTCQMCKGTGVRATERSSNG